MITHSLYNNHSQSSDEKPNLKSLDPSVSIVIKRKQFNEKNVHHIVMHDVNLTIQKQECLAILGPSGSGKTTLLRIIAGLDTDYEGTVLHNNDRVLGPSQSRGVVFQESRLLPWYTVRRNLEFALPDQAEDKERQRIDSLLELIDLKKFQHYWPHKLSGGMMKRVSLARALVNIPEILLLDEPFAGIDTHSKHTLQNEVAKVHDIEGLTTILVTHDIEEAVYLSDRIAILGGTPSTIKHVFKNQLPALRNRKSEEFKKTMSDIYAKLINYA